MVIPTVTGMTDRFIGADPEQLDTLATTLSRQQQVVHDVITTVTSVLAATAWTGPAREAFEHEWRDGFRTVLGRLSEAFVAAGRDCSARSADLRRAMGPMRPLP
jgi:uncharacterized protein YukE